MIPDSDLCKHCNAIPELNGRLLEAPRGHATFDNGLHYLSMKSPVY
jgi:hypothetical protein